MNKYLVLILLATVTITSCSSDDAVTDTNTTNQNNEGDYFPSNISDYWNYNIENTNNDTNQVLMNTDSLYVATGTASAFTLDVNDNMIASSSTNSLLTSGQLTRTNTSLSLNGTLELPPQLADLVDFEIAINNAVLYNINADSGTELSSTSNTISQDFNGFPLTITYSFTTIADGFLDSYSVSGVAYPDVTTTQFKLNLAVSTVVTVGPANVNLPIINPTDVLVSTNYFAKGIGLISTIANTNFQLSDQAIALLESNGPINVPTSGSSTTIQLLTDYSVTE